MSALDHTITQRLRPTIRVRLTLLYGGLFLAGGIVLLALTYLLVKGSLQPPGDKLFGKSGVTERTVEQGPPETSFSGTAPSPGRAPCCRPSRAGRSSGRPRTSSARR
ncbi:hypothetical protein GEV43_37740 [Actinomadura sp. J1-007]|uniref:hypothetical protein n=1 Tax=Actinomadura sp. J1-007 TaxID=2661913 RepID=UPI00132A6424|nr:hypothetical protein [Actinomadura sp. J1-007]MWK39205.1 hypothetical protein [Actinomadura sp. J1-007]